MFFCLSVNSSVCLSVCPSIHLSIFLSMMFVCLSVCLTVSLPALSVSVWMLSINLSVCLSICMFSSQWCLTVWLSDCLTVWLSDCQMSDCLTVWLSDCLTVWLSDVWLSDVWLSDVWLSRCLPNHLSIHLSVLQSMMSVCLSFGLSVCLSVGLSVCLPCLRLCPRCLSVNPSVYPLFCIPVNNICLLVCSLSFLPVSIDAWNFVLVKHSNLKVNFGLIFLNYHFLQRPLDSNPRSKYQQPALNNYLLKETRARTK
jgi:hypothetical protein